MNLKNIISTVFRVLAIVLTLAVLMPSAVKLTHAFNHESHVVCEDDTNDGTHFHQTDLDCEFYKFKHTNTYYFSPFDAGIDFKTPQYHTSFSYYSFVNSHQQLTSYLRGPPQLV